MKCPNCDSDDEMEEFEDTDGTDIRVCLTCGFEERR